MNESIIDREDDIDRWFFGLSYHAKTVVYDRFFEVSEKKVEEPKESTGYPYSTSNDAVDNVCLKCGYPKWNEPCPLCDEVKQ